MTQSSAKKNARARARERERRQAQAAVLLASGELRLDAIAQRLGVNRRTLTRWRKLPAVAARMEQEAQAARARFEREMRHLDAQRERQIRGMSEADLMRTLTRLWRRRRR